MIYFADFSATDKSDMFNILSGEIKFYPGWNVYGQAGIKAVNLKQTPESFISNAVQEKIMKEMYVEPEVQKDLKDMMKFVRMSNTLSEEA